MDERKEQEFDDKDIIKAFIKGLNVIKAFDKKNTTMTLSDIAKKVGITRASSRRFLLTLQSQGYVLNIGNNFSLTPKIIELGYSYFASLPWADLAYKNMKRVVDTCRLTCSISILNGVNVICITRIPAVRILSEGINVGTKLPSAYTASGRVFMAGMDEKELYNYILRLPLKKMTNKSIVKPDILYKKILDEKKNGYQIVIEEIEQGLVSMAVPVYNGNKEILGAMNIACQLSYKNEKVLRNEVLPMLIKAANDTSDEIKLLQY